MTDVIGPTSRRMISTSVDRVSTTGTALRRGLTERRIVVGLIVAAIGFVCVINPWAFYLLLLAIGLASIYEFSYLCTTKGQPLEYQVAVLGVCAYVAMAVFGLLHKWEGVLLAGT